MIPFDIYFMLSCLQYNLKQIDQGCEFDLTIKPTNPDFFVDIPPVERENYLRYISACFRIYFHGRVFYLFIRNGKDNNQRYTRLSSVELGYVTKTNSFKGLTKWHFDGLFDYYSSSEEEMTNKISVAVEQIIKDLKNGVSVTSC